LELQARRRPSQVPKTPDLKQKAAATSENPLLPLPELSDGPPPPAVSHDLSTKPSFQSTETATTTSENTNYKVYRGTSPRHLKLHLLPRLQVILIINFLVTRLPHRQSSSDSNVSLRTENYELHGDPSPSTSFVNLVQTHSKYSKNRWLSLH